MSKLLSIYLNATDDESALCWFDEQESGFADVQSLRLRGRSYSSIDVIVPGEQVVLLDASLPGSNQGRLRQAMPFAVEEQLAEEIDHYHFSLGERIDSAHHQVAATSKSQMRVWQDLISKLDLSIRQVRPDMMCLPDSDQSISIAIEGKRVLVRTSRTRGFVMGLDEALIVCAMQVDHSVVHLYPVGHSDQTQSSCRLMTTALSAAGQSVQDNAPSPGLVDLFAGVQSSPSRLNLMSGGLTQTPERLHKGVRLWTCAAATLLLSALVVLSTRWITLSDQEDALTQTREEQLAIIKRSFPEITEVRFPREQMQQAFESRQGTDAGDTFLSMLSLVGPALAEDRSVTLTGVSFRQQQLVLSLTAPDLASIDKLQQSLEDMGTIGVNIDSAVTQSSQAVVEMRVRRI